MGRDSFQKLKTIATWHAKTFRASLLCWASLCVALDSLIATCCNMQFFAMLCDWRAHLLQFSFANRHLICWESASMEDCVKQRGKKTIMQTPKENGLFAKNALPNVSNISHWWCYWMLGLRQISKDCLECLTAQIEEPQARYQVYHMRKTTCLKWLVDRIYISKVKQIQSTWHGYNRS